MSNGNQVQLYYTLESTFGVVPTDPAWVYLRESSNTLNLAIQTIDDDEITVAGQQTCQQHGNGDVQGDIVCPLIYGDQDALLEVAFGSSWVADVLKLDVTGNASIAFLEYDPNLSGAEKYRLFKGNRISSVASSKAQNGQIPMTYSIMGQDMELLTAPPSGSTGLDNTPATTTCPMITTAGDINKDGSAIATVTGFDWTLTRNIVSKFVIGSNRPYEQELGNFSVEGTLNTYTDDLSLYNDYISENEVSFDYEPIDGAGDKLKFEFPRMKVNGGNPDTSDNTERVLSQPVKMLYDSTEESTIILTRTDA